MKKNESKGITLIALVVTIIVLLILAGISIMMLTGENGLITQAKNAKEITSQAQIEEAVKLAYGSVSIEKYTNDNAVTLERIAEQLKQDGYTIETASGSGSETVTGISVNPTNVTIAPGETATVEVTVEKSTGEDTRYFVKQDGKYYEFVIENEEVKMLDAVTEIEGAGDTEKEITLSSSNESIVTATVNGTTIELTAGSSTGTGTITVKYGEEYTQTITVKVQAKPTEDSTADESVSMETGYGTIDVIWLSGTSNTVTTTPNAPILESNGEAMAPVTWTYDSSTSTWTEDETASSNWYSYNAGSGTSDNLKSKWANAKTANGSYFVWIPRYAYRITYYASQSAWKNGEEATGYYDGYGMWNTDGELKYKVDEGIKTVEYNGEKYIVHPAFETDLDLGGWSEELSGFWFAKYEMSGSETELKSVPNVESLLRMSIGTQYQVARKETYGYTGESETITSNGTKYTYTSYMSSHLVKNSEWGAVAYLTQSQYGRNGYEIDINNSSTYITGNGGGSTSASSASGTTNAYNTETGAKASTTGNIYGVYDMSGGAWEYVAGYDKLGSSTYLAGESYGLYLTQEAKDSSGNYISTKYATVYSNGTDTYYGTEKEHEVGKTGEATKEVNTQGGTNTSHWFTDYSYFVYSSFPFFNSGGHYSYGSPAGVFCSVFVNGGAYYYGSFRVVLVP